MAEGTLPRRFVDLDENFATEVGAASQAASHLLFAFRPSVISRWSAARPPEAAVGERARREQARSRLRAIVQSSPVLVPLSYCSIALHADNHQTGRTYVLHSSESRFGR